MKVKTLGHPQTLPIWHPNGLAERLFTLPVRLPPGLATGQAVPSPRDPHTYKLRCLERRIRTTHTTPPGRRSRGKGTPRGLAGSLCMTCMAAQIDKPRRSTCTPPAAAAPGQEGRG
eukprot:CAMPEP_0118932820 /NCGR_PEP_ID=MMETSP1169-20130426/10637_1 /TAXON_ID=36882 /ORGANISM="Pyramimonas obovata, Strain CCMP722" /LENGTH=115 /DNA_ID=CAMNT_0006875521 /DNA_START=159 /DNA_END=502 /DNA_ORIENTATION=-